MQSLFPARLGLVFTLLGCLCTLAACTAARSPYRGIEPVKNAVAVRDLRTFPQDLNVYAKASAKDTMLVTPAEQAAHDARFNRIFFSPWELNKASMSPRRFRKTFGTARGFDGVQPWTKSRWEAMRQNADVKRYPSRATTGITIRHTNLRELPSHSPRYDRPTPVPENDPFDLFQYSALPLGTPLFITHATRDRQWYFVEHPIAAGWVPAADVALADRAFINRYQNDRYAALIRDRVNVVSEQGEALGRVHIGAMFPLVETQGDDMVVLMPVRGPDGQAATTRVLLKDGQAVLKPLPVLPKLLAVVGNEMMAQPYGWGGMQENRDCSSTLRDLYTPFGIWLPRNSSSQARAGRFQDLQGLEVEAKERTILNDAVPFMTLIWMRGHIGLYVGKHKSRAAMFHNVWGVRMEEGHGVNERHVIGRCVVTSLEPGKELPNAKQDATILHRIRGMSTLPGAI